ncbi:AraC family transcriptional regulator [Dyella monticola]|uniref:AraC family transcriptional regulator n=1 Tax=Dyella monticola TaxID=1927958 RepID=A0A370WTB0_9GAMM|nr:AraC family transcriptional regulator [Dyella monticola]RDS79247.1 AraC family transcriptional regulator [Dyella monticola]
MIDPLAEVVLLLQPIARFSKLVEGAGHWRIRRPAIGEPFYCAVLEGQCRMSVDAHPAMTLQAGDFVLVPAMHTLVNESLQPPDGDEAGLPVEISDGHYRVGKRDGAADLRMRIGHCSFGSPDAALLVQLLPQVIHVRGEQRLATLVQLVGEETRAARFARELVLERLLEVLLIEALRCSHGTTTTPGLARGLADERLACALRAFHARPEHPWTIAGLAREAALSRSAFFARFNRTVGVSPMEYVLAWRMALAKRLLRDRDLEITAIAERVGYSSASTFSVAFTRQVGTSPARYGRGYE